MSTMPIARRAALFQDLSGVGRCALTVAIPVLSVMNAQPCPVPTAALSAHTAFPAIAARDLTDFVQDAIAAWEKEEFFFDAVMSGYLSDDRQAALIGGYIDSLRGRGKPLVLVDPAMADHGRLYRGLPQSMPETMRALCARADLIAPNPTEAALLTGRPYSDGPISDRDAALLLRRLLDIGCGCAVMTGARLMDGRMANLCMRKGESAYYRVAYAPLDGAYPGTGDLFAAVLLGGILGGESAPDAMARATEFNYRSIERTLRLGTPPREGVQFEALLASLPGMRGYRVERVAYQ